MRHTLADPARPAEPLHVIVDTWRRRVPPPISLPCVCAGPEIVSASHLAADIQVAVQRHQIEPLHIAHDQRQGIPLAAWQRAAMVGR